VTNFSEAVKAAEQRSATKGPRAISRAAKAKGFTLSHGTVSKVLNGTHGNVNDETILGLAAVLPITEDQLREALGVAGAGPYKPPAAADRLTTVQRDLINALIHQIVRPEVGASTENVDGSPAVELERSGEVIEGNFGGPDPTDLIGKIPADAPGSESEGERLRREQDEDAAPTQDDGDEK
jgi:hypothetical protein